MKNSNFVFHNKNHTFSPNTRKKAERCW